MDPTCTSTDSREMTQQWDRDASISDRLSERGAIESPNLLCTRTGGLLFDSDALLSAIERYFGEKDVDLVKDAEAGYIATIRNHPDVRKDSQATRIGLPPRGPQRQRKRKESISHMGGNITVPGQQHPSFGGKTSQCWSMGHKEKHCCIEDACHAWNEKEEASTTHRNQKTVSRRTSEPSRQCRCVSRAMHASLWSRTSSEEWTGHGAADTEHQLCECAFYPNIGQSKKGTTWNGR